MLYKLSEWEPVTKDEIAWKYNAQDCIITEEIYHKLRPELEEANIRKTYEFAMAKQAVCIEMELRGVALDRFRIAQILKKLNMEVTYLQNLFDYLCQETIGKIVNINSPAQVNDLFYKHLSLAPIKKRNEHGMFAPTTDKNALIQLQQYIVAKPFVIFILALRDKKKQQSFLKGLNTPRLYTSFIVPGTVTGRLASKYSDFGTGTNMQNPDRRVRSIFVADPGYVFLNIDLEQADSRNLGAILHNLFYDTEGEEYAGKYLRACESGDLHSTVASMVWPEIEDYVGEIFYGQDNYRQVAKKLGHATNFAGAPVGMAKQTAVLSSLIKQFQQKYFKAFPAIPRWHSWIENHALKAYPGQLTTLYGRKRNFYGRIRDHSTKRDAAANCPQSMTAHQIDKATHAAWLRYTFFQPLLQVHDSILAQIPVDCVHYVPDILKTMADSYTITLKGVRRFTVPLEAKVGKNWGDYDKDSNPNGLKKV